MFQEVTFYTTITDEQLNLRILDNGGADVNWVIVSLTVQPGSPPELPTEAYFDFGTASSPVASGYVRVAESALYSASTGYGWTDTIGLSSRDRGAPDDLRCDLVQSATEHTFNVDLANGDYEVTVVIGDQSYMHDLIDVYAEGNLVINDLTVAGGMFQEVTFSVSVSDEQLSLMFSDGGGVDSNWVINSLSIRMASA